MLGRSGRPFRRALPAVACAATLVVLGGLASPTLAGAKAAATTTATVSSTSTGTTTASSTAPLVGFDEQWDTQGGFDLMLSDADIANLKALGATSVRFPVKCSSVGACAFNARFDDTVDFSTVTTWDFTKLDAAVSRLRAAGITPVIGPHPGDRMFRPGYIVDDNAFASTKAFVQKVVAHLNSKFGPLPYSFFESEMDTSLITDAAGVSHYRYLTASGFPASFASGLATLYGNNIASLNQAYGTSYASFTAVPVPDLGTSLGVPSTVFDSPATYDLRRVIGSLSASRYSQIGDLIHKASPGSEWWGPTVQLQSFDDRRQVHTPSLLTPVGPTLSDLAAQPGIDVVSVDGYRDDDSGYAAAEWRVAAKLTARRGKRLAITEIGGPSLDDLQRAMTGVLSGASNLRAVLVWQGKDSSSTDRFGVIGRDGVVKAGYGAPVQQFLSQLATAAGYRTYATGTEAVYFPEWSLQVVQSGKLTTTKTLHLMADLMHAGYTVEPLVDDDVATAPWTRLSVYSLYLGERARAALVATSRPVVAYQYASHRTGFSGGKPVDVSVWPARNGFTASPPEATPRVADVVTLLGSQYPVAVDYRLNGWPFVHEVSLGTNTVIATHSAPIVDYPLALRSPSGSLWFDSYVGPDAVPATYALH